MSATAVKAAAPPSPSSQPARLSASPAHSPAAASPAVSPAKALISPVLKSSPVNHTNNSNAQPKVEAVAENLSGTKPPVDSSPSKTVEGIAVPAPAALNNTVNHAPTSIPVNNDTQPKHVPTPPNGTTAKPVVPPTTTNSDTVKPVAENSEKETPVTENAPVKADPVTNHSSPVTSATTTEKARETSTNAKDQQNASSDTTSKSTEGKTEEPPKAEVPAAPKPEPPTTLVKSTPQATKKRKREPKDTVAKPQTPYTPVEDRKSRRTRIQTQPYQSPLPELQQLLTKFKPETPKGTEERIIVFYKGEFLAVRNAEGGFYVCQAVQNIHKGSRKIRIRWLSLVEGPENPTKDIYSPDFYDHTDFDCILTNLDMDRIEKGKYRMPEEERKRTESILKRSLDVETGVAEKAPITEEHPDGLDVSLFKDESQLKKRRQSGSRKTSTSPNPRRRVSESDDTKSPSKSPATPPAKKADAEKQKSSRQTKSAAKRTRENTDSPVEEKKSRVVPSRKDTADKKETNAANPNVSTRSRDQVETANLKTAAPNNKPMTVWSGRSTRRSSAASFMESLGLKGSRNLKASTPAQPPKGKVSERRKVAKDSKNRKSV